MALQLGLWQESPQPSEAFWAWHVSIFAAYLAFQIHKIFSVLSHIDTEIQRRSQISRRRPLNATLPTFKTKEPPAVLSGAPPQGGATHHLWFNRCSLGLAQKVHILIRLQLSRKGHVEACF